jgi:hypothetical protein
MEITFKEDDIVDIIYSALCQSLDWLHDDGYRIGYEDDVYSKAVAELESEYDNPNPLPFYRPCHEDIVMRILLNGDTIKMIDVFEGKADVFSLEDLLHNISLVDPDIMLSYVKEKNNIAESYELIQIIFEL